jgi:hypothetical protein
MFVLKVSLWKAIYLRYSAANTTISTLRFRAIEAGSSASTMGCVSA